MKMGVREQRSTNDVFESHLQCRMAGDIEHDLQRNYADDVTLICEWGVHHGKDAARESATRLKRQLRGANFEFLCKRVDGEYAFLVWKASSPDARIDHGVDSFVIRDGHIVMQTISYRLIDGPPTPPAN